MNILFWIIAGIDAAAVIGVFGFIVLFALGSKSNLFSVLGMSLGLLAIGTVLIGGPVLLYLRSKSVIGRSAALAIVSLPLVVVAISAVLQNLVQEPRDHWDVSGRLIHFESGRARALESAIVAGNVADVAALRHKVDLKKPGAKGATFLHVSVREIWRTTNQIDVLKLLLDGGADLSLKDDDGHDALHHAVMAAHWHAVRLLLQRGADGKSFRTAEGQTLQTYLESKINTPSAGDGFAEVLEWVRSSGRG